MRCKHCSHLPIADRYSKHTIFPNSMGGFVYAYSSWFGHLMECKSISSEIRNDVLDLSSRKFQSTLTSYFFRLFDELGLKDIPDKNGIRASGRTDLQTMTDELIDTKDGDDESSLTTTSLTSNESCLRACGSIVKSPLKSYERMYGIPESVTPSSLKAFEDALLSNKENAICGQFTDAFSKEYRTGKKVAKELFLGDREKRGDGETTEAKKIQAISNGSDKESGNITMQSDPMMIYGGVDYSESRNPLYDFSRDVLLEVFVPTKKDAAECPFKQSVTAGSFGLRCKFCSELPRDQCENRASSFPKNQVALSGFLASWQIEHLVPKKYSKCKRCKKIPDEVVDKYRYLEKFHAELSRVQYWLREVEKLGFKFDAQRNRFLPTGR